MWYLFFTRRPHEPRTMDGHIERRGLRLFRSRELHAGLCRPDAHRSVSPTRVQLLRVHLMG